MLGNQNNQKDATTVLVQVGSLQKGNYYMMNGHPCKIIELSTVTTGKHGSARVGIVGNDIFTSKRYEESRPISGTVEVPIVSKKEYEVAEINQNEYVTLILQDGDTKSSLQLPKDDKEVYASVKKTWETKGINDRCLFTVLSAVGQEKIISARIA